MDECVKINPHGVKPGVEFHVEKVLYTGRAPHQLYEDRPRYEGSPPINEEYFTRMVEEMENDEESTPHEEQRRRMEEVRNKSSLTV